MSRRRPARLTTHPVLNALVIFGLALSACAPDADEGPTTPDRALEARVAAAIANASDLPAEAFTVIASGGVVKITGSVVCEDCGGMRTPAGIQSIQQSLGAVARAVPGVERVEFDLAYSR